MGFKLRLFLIALLVVLLSGCYDGTVRYPCQEAKNWNKPACNPPQCYAEGECTKDLFTTEQYDDIKKELNK